MVERVAETITRYSMLPRGGRVAVAVSGGPDSVCLLHILQELAPRFGVTLSVAHLNHGLRGEESDEDARFVSNLAASLGLEAVIREDNVTGSNLEEAGRKARIAFFRSLRVDRVATGHTASDQAETVLMRIIRGSGITGLRGILPVTGDGRVRPLLCCCRRDVEHYVRDHRLPARIDSSNRDSRFARNRVRHRIMPELRAENPDVESALARLAGLAADDEHYWNQQVAATGLVGRVIQVSGLHRHPAGLARRIIRESIRLVKGDLRRIDAGHIEQVLRLVHCDRGSGAAALPGVDARRSQEWIRFIEPSVRRVPPEYVRQVEAPGVWDLGHGEVLHLERLDKSGNKGEKGYTEGCHWVDADLAEPLLLRPWRPGDRIGLPGHKERKLKWLFQRARIPLWERSGWPVLESSNRIVWVKRFGVAGEFAVSAISRRVLRITVEPVISSA